MSCKFSRMTLQSSLEEWIKIMNFLVLDLEVFNMLGKKSFWESFFQSSFVHNAHMKHFIIQKGQKKREDILNEYLS